jgi:formylglycine-generating enzyme required for sulfatase activity
LLPRLAEHVVAVCVDATPTDTESHLRARLRKRLDDVPEDMSLPELLEWIREGQGLPTGGKLLIVLDQFEQWLHARRGEQSDALISALRHCDGGRVQCLLMVRDDFWLAVSRFLSELEVPLVQGRNASLVDLFDAQHARNVLAEFGRSYGCLPTAVRDQTAEQNHFLEQAIQALAPEGRVVCVRLALFAEMMKGRSWTSDTLQRVGGAEGIGVTFLEETFSAPTAPPEHCLHERAAQAVLEILLPAPGTDIKTCMRHHDELLDASGYRDRPERFHSLLGILDHETRLITPTEVAAAERDGREEPPAQPAPRYYQLTHDYLVGSLREWLNRKRKETSRGRAELRLAERAAQWSVKPKSRNLPVWWEDLSIRIWTQPRRWTSTQRQMMRLSGRRHAARTLGLLTILFVLIWAGFETYGFARAVDLVSNLIKADIEGVPQCIEDLKPFHRWARGRLAPLADGDVDSNDKLRASLALVEHDVSHLDYLCERVLSATPRELEVICRAVEPYETAVTARFWDVARGPVGEQTRFNAACALAHFASPQDPRWASIDGFLSSRLVQTVSRYPRDYEVWLRMLAPQRRRLASSLGPLVYDGQRSELQRDTALNILVEYIDDQPELVANVLMEATPNQFERLYTLARSHSSKVAPRLETELKKPLADERNEEEKEHLGQRQARAAIALLRMGRAAEVRPLLRATPDPRPRTYFVHWAREFSLEASQLIDQLMTSPTGEEAAVHRALLLSLGDFPLDQLPQQQQEPLVAKLVKIYRSHPDSGLHGAAWWLLRKWGHDEDLVTVDQQLSENEDELRARSSTDRRSWYVNSLGDTFVILDSGQYAMGSPDTEPGREACEVRHSRRIGRRFAMAATEVTRKQFERFLRSVHGAQVETDYAAAVAQDSPTENSPAVRPTWFDAAEYCNWLSKCEGIPPEQWCYKTNEYDEFYIGMKPARNYLTLTGYRLPTESEWEYACRGDTVTSRYYGAASELLVHYGWYEANSGAHAWPVALLQPNDFGLFDMLGNVYEWCHERYRPYPDVSAEPHADVVDMQKVEERIGRVKRGGSYQHFDRHLRSASRGYGDPANRTSSVGFRPVRTFR